MKKFIIILFTVLVLAFFILLNDSILRSDLPNKILIENKVLTIEVADNPEEQIRGLSDRPFLATDTGMLFIFNDKRPRSFWMKNMHFPIDIIWIRENLIVKIDANLPPEGERPARTYDSIIPADQVLEVNAGVAANNNFKIGSRVKILK